MAHDPRNRRPDANRGHLKIFFGACPGAGKTFAMLDAARRARARGLAITIGVIETHGRGELDALLTDVPAVPLRNGELDLEAALALAPAVLVVDTLAHTNAQGSRHTKRWQDIVELLDAGVDVWTTANVHDVESLGDVIQQITGLRIDETIPDAVLERAELILVDVSPDDLLERFREGKVVVPVRIAGAHDGLFSRGSLLSLRELALRHIAARVDADVLAYRRAHGIDTPWATRERILVCVGPSPGSERLIRATKRMAEGLHATWTAAYVDVVGTPPLAARDRERIDAHLRLAESLGAEVLRLHGDRVAEALLEHARGHDVTRIVAGKPTHSRWRDRVRGSMLDTLIRGSGPIEIHVIAPIEVEPALASEPRRRESAAPISYVWSVVAIALTTAIGLVAYSAGVATPDITMLYLIAIMVVSLAGRGPSLVAASLAVAAFDFCFVPPRFTFAVTQVHNVLTFVVMFVSGLAISTLTVRLRREQRDAVSREQRTAALLAFTREVSSATTASDVAAVTARHLEETLDVAAAVLLPDEADELVAAAGLVPLSAESQEMTVARWVFDHREVAGHGTDTLQGARALCVPLADGETPLGVIAIQRRAGTPPRLTIDQRHLVDALARQAALALARVMFAERAREATLLARTEELRSSLLSAVSHDLRTPLAVITGAATTLRDDSAGLTPAARAELLTSIVDDARRLERVLNNLLQLTRVETGFVPPREWVPAEEVVGAALTRLEEVIGDSKVDLDVEADLMLWIDPVLFEQVLINLLDNAMHHGAPPLSVRVAREAGQSTRVAIEVADRGRGLPKETTKLFEKFVRASHAPGAGLGLAVVRAIVEAHGGTVVGENRDGGGAVFRISLPAPQPPPSVAPRSSQLELQP